MNVVVFSYKNRKRPSFGKAGATSYVLSYLNWTTIYLFLIKIEWQCIDYKYFIPLFLKESILCRSLNSTDKMIKLLSQTSWLRFESRCLPLYVRVYNDSVIKIKTWPTYITKWIIYFCTKVIILVCKYGASNFLLKGKNINNSSGLKQKIYFDLTWRPKQPDMKSQKMMTHTTIKM